MRFVLCTELDCPPAKAIDHARTPRLLAYVAAPWLRFEPVDPPAWPEAWEPASYRVRMRLAGGLLLGTQTIGIETVEQRGDRLLVHDVGSSDLLELWDHRIEITPAEGGRTRYCDRVEIEAGRRTPFLWLFARLFFAHRHRRWRKLVRSGFDYSR